MTNRLLAAWDWEPSVVIGCAALLIARAAWLRRQRIAWFAAGVLLLLLDLVSPLDMLADGYLFSAHIVQHFLLALVIPPLLLLGLPDEPAGWRKRLFHRGINPVVAWVLGVGTMLIWHVPAFFNAALASDALHIFQHLSFLASGAIFWWPVFAPAPEKRIEAAIAVPYLFGACTACSLLGAAITFSSTGLYPAYLHPNDPLGILPLIRDGWGLDARNDQQLGGLLMWVPGCFVYLSAILVTVARWYGTPERFVEARG